MREVCVCHHLAAHGREQVELALARGHDLCRVPHLDLPRDANVDDRAWHDVVCQLVLDEEDCLLERLLQLHGHGRSEEELLERSEKLQVRTVKLVDQVVNIVVERHMRLNHDTFYHQVGAWQDSITEDNGKLFAALKFVIGEWINEFKLVSRHFSARWSRLKADGLGQVAIEANLLGQSHLNVGWTFNCVRHKEA